MEDEDMDMGPSWSDLFDFPAPLARAPMCQHCQKPKKWGYAEGWLCPEERA